MERKAIKFRVMLRPMFLILRLDRKLTESHIYTGDLPPPVLIAPEYIIRSADLGKAYISDKWAADFISELLKRYTVVLVGYKAEDVPLKYLLKGLHLDGLVKRNKLFAFDRGNPNELDYRWRDKGVTSIAFQEYDHLWNAVSAWADLADDPQRWRRSVVRGAKRTPKTMLPHERGKVAHVLRSIPGAKLFAEEEPSPHPEWICVLDASVRSGSNASVYDEVDPVSDYGLDNDIESSDHHDSLPDSGNDNLLKWRQGDDNPPEFHQLGSRKSEGGEAMPLRLEYLALWVAKSYHSSIIAWWAARQNGLHPVLIDRISSYVGKGAQAPEKCQRIWKLILESHRDNRNRKLDGGWYEFEWQLDREGWTSNVLRMFRHTCRPRLEVQRPVGPHRNIPPSAGWSELELGNIGEFYVRYMTRRDNAIGILNVPDETLPSVFRIIVDHLALVAGLLTDIEHSFFRTPSCHSESESKEEEYHYDFITPFRLLIKLLDRFSMLNSDLAKSHVLIWDENDRYFFRKLKLYALSKEELFNANEVANIINSFDQESMWDFQVAHEFLVALVVHWKNFSGDNRKLIVKRILRGPDKRDHWSDQEYANLRDERAATYGRYLQLNGCELPVQLSAELDSLIAGIEGWSDGWARSIGMVQKTLCGFVETDDVPDVLLELKLAEIVPCAEKALQREFGSFTKKMPFTGLVKVNPRRALSALTVEARKGSFPNFAWKALIEEFSKDVSSRLYRVFLNRLTRLPDAHVVEFHYTIDLWLASNLVDAVKFDFDLGWKVYDHFVDAFLGRESKSHEGDDGEDKPGDHTVHKLEQATSDSVSHSLGKCALALLEVVVKERQQAGSLIPDHIRTRLARLLKIHDKGSHSTIFSLMSNLNDIMHIDPAWAKEKLIPKLAFEHTASEPAWHGLFRNRKYPSIEVSKTIKPLLFNLYPWVKSLDWYEDVSEIAVGWMAWMYVFRHGEPDGLDSGEIRDLINVMGKRSRCQVIYWLGELGKSNEDGWSSFVIPFIDDIWPVDLEFRCKDSTSHWLSLLDNTGEDFPAVYTAVKGLLVPVDVGRVRFYRFTCGKKGEKSITTQHPNEVLDLMDVMVPGELSRLSDALPTILKLIREAAPELESDRRYIRLMNLVDRT